MLDSYLKQAHAATNQPKENQLHKYTLNHTHQT